MGNLMEILCFFAYRLISESVLQDVSSSELVSSKTVWFVFRDFASKFALRRVLEFQMLIKLFRSELFQVLILCGL
jgi:hypothetical protein